MALKVLANTSAAASQKQKVQQSIAHASAEVTARADLVDELVMLTHDLDKFEPQFKRRDEIKKELAAAANEEFADNEKAVFHGNVGSAEFSARSEVRKITDMNDLIGKLKDKIGYDGLLALLKLTLGDCEQYLSKEELKPYITKVAGSRTFKGVTITDPTLLNE